MTLSSEEIAKLLPHRFPFLLIDRALDLQPGKYCKAQKNVTFNEPFFPGHFPGAPTMPGVLIIESMAQAGALILLSMEEHRGRGLYLAGLEKARFRRPVVPGDVLIHEISLMWHRRGFGRIDCKSTVDGELVAEAEIAYSLTDPAP